MNKVKEARVKKWLRALRSGKYAQTRGTLKADDGYCCLGVACDVYRKETGEGEWQDAGQSAGEPARRRYAFVLPDDRDEGTLPTKVAKWFGLRTVDGGYKYNRGVSESTTLVSRNDDDRAGFAEIANIIEGKRGDHKKRVSLFGRFER